MAIDHPGAHSGVMKRIEYSGGSFLTCDEVASELLGYGAELAEHGLARTVEVPMIGVDGAAGVAELLLGPASQIVALAEPGGELDCGDAAAELRAAREGLDARWRMPSLPSDDFGSSMIDPI